MAAGRAAALGAIVRARRASTLAVNQRDRINKFTAGPSMPVGGRQSGPLPWSFPHRGHLRDRP